MKKVILTLSVIGFMTACSSSTTTEEVKTDSTAVAIAVDTVNVPTMDTVKAATVETTPTTK